MFNELEKRVEDATNLTHFVARSPVGSEGIELVEQVNSPGLADRVEYQTKLGCRFAQVLGNQAMELNAEQRKLSSPARTDAVIVLPVPGGPTKSRRR